MTIDNKIRDEKLQNYFNREVYYKILALSSGNREVSKYQLYHQVKLINKIIFQVKK